MGDLGLWLFFVKVMKFEAVPWCRSIFNHWAKYLGSFKSGSLQGSVPGSFLNLLRIVSPLFFLKPGILDVRLTCVVLCNLLIFVLFLVPICFTLGDNLNFSF